MGLPHDISILTFSKSTSQTRQTYDRDNNEYGLYVPTEKISPKGLMGVVVEKVECRRAGGLAKGAREPKMFCCAPLALNGPLSESGSGETQYRSYR